jgi:hypothetical protein
MKRILVLMLFCYSAASKAGLDDACVNECTSKGYQYYLCESRCSNSDNSQVMQPEQLSQPIPQAGDEINLNNKNESQIGDPVLSTADKTGLVGNDDKYKKGPYGYFDSGLLLFSNAPQSNTKGFQLGGGYHFDRHIGVEGGISIIDDATSDNSLCGFVDCLNESLGADSSQIYVVGTLPLTDQSSLFGKLGWARTSLKYSYSDTPCLFYFCGRSVSGNGSASKINPMFGIGWEKNKQRLRFRVQYENFGTIKMIAKYSDGSTNTFDIGIEVISVGLTYKF